MTFSPLLGLPPSAGSNTILYCGKPKKYFHHHNHCHNGCSSELIIMIIIEIVMIIIITTCIDHQMHHHNLITILMDNHLLSFPPSAPQRFPSHRLFRELKANTASFSP